MDKKSTRTAESFSETAWSTAEKKMVVQSKPDRVKFLVVHSSRKFTSRSVTDTAWSTAEKNGRSRSTKLDGYVKIDFISG